MGGRAVRPRAVHHGVVTTVQSICPAVWDNNVPCNNTVVSGNTAGIP